MIRSRCPLPSRSAAAAVEEYQRSPPSINSCAANSAADGGVFESAGVLRQLKALGVRTVMLTGDRRHAAESVAREVAEFNFGLRVMLDPRQKVGEALGVNRTAEVYVIDPKSWTLMYHGPIDDRLNYESQRPVHHRYLSDALDAMLAGKPVVVASASSPGCLINFPNRKHG